MLKIREQQMKAFDIAAMQSFEDEMVEHSGEFSPTLCQVLGEKQLRVALRQTIQRAKDYGFTNRGPIRLCIELMFLCGSGFDTDPQYPEVGKVLNASGDQMQRAKLISEEINDYIENVSGVDGINVHNALAALAKLARQPLTFSVDNFVAEIFQEMSLVFPKKASYIGKEGLTKLINKGCVEARTYDFPEIRGDALLVIMKFAFGHECTSDPLYPWVSQTLSDKRIVSPDARAKRLEKKALTWLDHVLARPRQAAQG